VTTGHASSTHSPTQESSLRITITIDGQTFHATLTNSQANHDLIEQLPQALEMRDHGGVEKTGRLRAPLSLQGQPRGADPAIGDVGYYAPGRDFVLYYGDQFLLRRNRRPRSNGRWRRRTPQTRRRISDRPHRRRPRLIDESETTLSPACPTARAGRAAPIHDVRSDTRE
jgi:hypothetical protein